MGYDRIRVERMRIGMPLGFGQEDDLGVGLVARDRDRRAVVGERRTAAPTGPAISTVAAPAGPSGEAREVGRLRLGIARVELEIGIARLQRDLRGAQEKEVLDRGARRL